MTGSCWRLLAETGMRIGQALGLRHADFVSRAKEVRIVPRADNANGARAKLRSPAVIPVTAGLVRAYSDYMHAEYGDVDSDYVFVNLWAGPDRRADDLRGGARPRRPHPGRARASSSRCTCCATPTPPS